MNNDLNSLENYLGLKRIHEHWLSFFILGILLILLGMLSIGYANYATLVDVIYFGFIIAIGGIVQIIYAFWARRGQGFFQMLLLGIFSTIVGGLLVTRPLASAVAITLLLAAFYTVSGIFKIITCLTNPVTQKGWLLFSGFISLALGLLIWAQWPYSGLWVIGLFIGIDLIFIGWFWLMISLSAKNPEIKE